MKKLFSAVVLSALVSGSTVAGFAQKSRIVRPSLKTEATVPPPTVLYEDQTLELSSVAALTDGTGVFITWNSANERNLAGFRVLRMNEKGLASEPHFLAGAAMRTTDPGVTTQSYEYFDATAGDGDVYYLDAVSLDGGRRMFGPFSVERVANLEKVTGRSSAEMMNAEINKPRQVKESFVPSDALRTEMESAELAPNLVMQRWVAGQPGAKIAVQQEGMQRVSRAALAAAGFNVAASSSNWRLFAEGNEQAIIVAPDESYIEFFGRPIDTAESGTRVYYLVADGVPGKRMTPRTITPQRGVAGSGYRHSFVRKDRVTYLSSNLLNGDDENFFGSNVIIGHSTNPPATTTLNFNLTGVNSGGAKATLSIRVQGISASSHQVQPRINGQPLTMITGNGLVSMVRTYSIPATHLLEGANTVQFQAMGGGADINLPDTIRIEYDRAFTAAQDRVGFYTLNNRSALVTGFTSANVRLFDMTRPDDIQVVSNAAVESSNGSFSLRLPAGRGRAYYAVADTGVVTSAAVTANLPSQLATPAHDGTLVIITHRDWMTQSEDWANYRRQQGVAVEVVDVEDIFDEFSYGSTSTAAITQFLQYAQTNWQVSPNYVLLMGDATYDFRNYENRPFQSLVPTKRVDTVYEETGSDEALCDFNNDGLAELAVGRLPVRSGAMVTQFLTKTQAFESTLATAWSRGALFTSDLPNGYDFAALNQRVSTHVPAGIPREFINRGQQDSRNLLINSLNSGKYFVNYSGHGSAGIWDGNWLTTNDGPLFTNTPNYTMYFMLTCLNGYFLRTTFDSLGEALLKANSGGAVAVWASTGKTTPDVQEVMATRFYSQFSTPSLVRLGDLVKDAKAGLNGGRDVRLSWALLGDPMLRVKP